MSVPNTNFEDCTSVHSSVFILVFSNVNQCLNVVMLFVDSHHNLEPEPTHLPMGVCVDNLTKVSMHTLTFPWLPPGLENLGK